MPAVLDKREGGAQSSALIEALKSRNYDYEYPEGLDLKPGSEMHTLIINEVHSRARASRDVIQNRFSGWKEIDRTLTAYIDLDDEEEALQDADSRKPVSIVVPMSYATMETLLTYWSAAFLEDPIFRYEGVGPEDVHGAILLEMLIAYQCRRSRVALDLHTIWRDGFAYGFGAGYVGWKKETTMRTMYEEETSFSRFRNKVLGTGRSSRVRRRVTEYEGGFVQALDPYKCLPDPDVPIHDVDEMEFFGWVDRTNLTSVLALERDNSDRYFNAKYLRHIDGKSQMYNEHDSGRHDKHNYTVERSEVGNPVDITTMFISIIPDAFETDSGQKLGRGDYPETWVFEVAGDSIVIRAEKLDLDHGKLPIAINAPDFDGHSLTPISRMETIYGLQMTMDWLFQSHIANVRKAINDMLVVDPQIINIHDVTNPKPGKVIRLRRPAWGRGVKEAVMQLNVSDVTKGHIQDASYIADMISRVSAAQDSVAGVRRQTSARVSAAEAEGTRMGALSRLEKAARITSLQAHHDIAYQMAWNTRQFMEDETYVRVVGDWEQVLADDFGQTPDKGRMPVGPRDLDIDFDVISSDGTIPGSGNVEPWTQIFQVIAANPMLAQKFDVVKIFQHIARMSGAKNLNDFVKNTPVNAAVLPDEQVADMAQAGNVVPIPGMGGAV